jgi:crossover junction endodeoxyribonuclease RuvC
MRILGLDPSLTSTGWALIENGKLIRCGTIKTKAKDGDFITRLRIINYRLISEAITGAFADFAAIEDVFVNRRNIKTSIQLAKLHGSMLSTIQSSGIYNKIKIYDNRFIKQTITDYGNASKEQVMKMVKIMAGYTGKSDDIADAIAVALTCEREIREKTMMRGDNK